MPIRSGLTNAGKGRPKGALNKTTHEIREAARAILDRPEYRASLQKRLDAGKAPHMEVLLHHYGYGKPKDVREQRNVGPIVIRWADHSDSGDTDS